MELKQGDCFRPHRIRVAFNRTRMELKLVPGLGPIAHVLTFNRTRMELKPFQGAALQASPGLLTVPEWN